jgi:hypothetical protein
MTTAMRLQRSLFLGLMVACGGGGGADDDPGPDAGVDGAGSNTVDGCAADALDRCDYQPAATYAPAQPMTVDLDYVDVTGARRTFQVAVRAPVRAPEPLPVVVWSHGGNDGRVGALGVGVEWAAIFVSAGYLVVDIAHAPRDAASQAALCRQLGYDAAGCLTFKHLHWDRPHDAARVFDFIEAQAASGPFAGRIDADRIVYAGHSAGAGGTLMVNGATRDFAGTQTSLADPRPIAFVSNSPQGPGEEGFVESSYTACARPTLVNSGIGDDTESVAGENRARAYDAMPAGDKHRLYLLEEAARHGTFDQSPDACEDYSRANGLPVARCGEYKAWLRSSALAFLDAYARDAAAARAYLASDNLAVLAGGDATWSRK